MLLQNVTLVGTVEDLFADITVTQQYRNFDRDKARAELFVLVPVKAALLDIQVRFSDHPTHGKIVGRPLGAAGSSELVFPFEAVKPGRFSLDAGHLMPGKSVTLRYRYALFLPWQQEHVSLFLPNPYDTPIVGGKKPADSKASPMERIAIEKQRALSCDLQFNGLLTKAKIGTRSHKLAMEPGEAGNFLKIKEKPAGTRNIRITFETETVPPVVAMSDRDISGHLVTAACRPHVQPAPGMQRALTVIIDTSMPPAEQAQAVQAYQQIVKRLRLDDRFQVVAVADPPLSLFDKPQPVTEDTIAQAGLLMPILAHAWGRREGAAPDGSPDRHARALRAALRCRPPKKYPWDILFITDSRVREPTELLQVATKIPCRIFPIGVGAASPEPVLQPLALQTRGAYEQVSYDLPVAECVQRQITRLLNPLVDVVVHWPDEPERVFPKTIPPFFQGDRLMVFGWFKKPVEGTITFDLRPQVGRRTRLSTTIRRLPPAPADLDDGSFGHSVPNAGAVARVAAADRLMRVRDRSQIKTLIERYRLVRSPRMAVMRPDPSLPSPDPLPSLHDRAWRRLTAKVDDDAPLGLVLRQTLHAEPPPPPDPKPLSNQLMSWFGNLVDDESSATSAFGAVDENWRRIPFMTLGDYGIPEGVLDTACRLILAGEPAKDIQVILLFLLAHSTIPARIDRRSRHSLSIAFLNRNPRLVETLKVAYWAASIGVRLTKKTEEETSDNPEKEA